MMATGGRVLTVLPALLLGLATGADAGEPARLSHSTAGHVVMPHPNACACCNEEKGYCERLWEKLRPGHRDRYVTRQHSRHLNHPECPPACMENFGYYQTCWRRFPEHTLGCRYCWDAGSPPLPAAPAPVPVTPTVVPAVPAPALSAPPAPPSQPPAELKAIPPLEYDTPPAAEPEAADLTPTIITPAGAWWNDPAWQAGLRRAPNAPATVQRGVDHVEPLTSAAPLDPRFKDPAWKAGLRSR